MQRTGGGCVCFAVHPARIFRSLSVRSPRRSCFVSAADFALHPYPRRQVHPRADRSSQNVPPRFRIIHAARTVRTHAVHPPNIRVLRAQKALSSDPSALRSAAGVCRLCAKPKREGVKPSLPPFGIIPYLSAEIRTPSENQTMPCAIIASATLRNPAMFAPATKLPFIPYFSHASETFL